MPKIRVVVCQVPNEIPDVIDVDDDHWNEMTSQEQEDYCQELLLNHLNNVVSYYHEVIE